MKTKSMSHKVVSFLAFLGMFLGIISSMTFVNPVFAAGVSYNRDAAVNWANNNNYNDGKSRGDSDGRWCTTYVTKAMQAGGINVPTYNGNVALAEWLREHRDLWVLQPKEQLQKGDIVFLSHYNELGGLNITHSGGANHVILITGSGIYSAWNAERINKAFSWFAGAWEYEQGVHFVTGSTLTTPPPPPHVFKNGVSRLWQDQNWGRANLTITADNLAGNIVYVHFFRAGRDWTYSQYATSNTMTFYDLDGAGPLNRYTTYSTQAALNQQPGNSWPIPCAAATGGQGLCDKIYRP